MSHFLIRDPAGSATLVGSLRPSGGWAPEWDEAGDDRSDVRVVSSDGTDVESTAEVVGDSSSSDRVDPIRIMGGTMDLGHFDDFCA